MALLSYPLLMFLFHESDAARVAMFLYECLRAFEWLVLRIYICLLGDGLYVRFSYMVNKLSNIM